MAYKKARAFEKRVSSLLVSKWDIRYSGMVGFVCVRMSIMAVVRSNTLLLCGSIALFVWRPEIEDGAKFEAMVCPCT